MSILVISSDIYGFGGIQLFSQLALRALGEEFTGTEDIHVLSRMDRDKQFRSHGVMYRYKACAGNLFRFSVEMIRMINSRRWDAVFLLHVNFVRLLPLRFRTAPVGVMLHGIEVWNRLPLTFRLGLRGIQKAIANSDYTVRRAREVNPWMANIPTSVCHLGVPESSGESVLSDHPPGSEYLLSIGRMVEQERYKGFDELIAIWPRVQVSRPGIRLVLIGDGPDRPRLESLARSNGAAVEFLGRVSDSERDRYLKHCRGFAMPSRAEGFGLVYLEAMRLGRPVLTGDSDAGCEVIEDRISGRAVNPINPDALFEGIQDLLGPNGASYGDAGLRRFQERFTYSHFKKRFLAEIHNLISKK